MKFDIENKILIIFISIVLLIIVFLGSASYINSYRLLINGYKKNTQEKLQILDNYIEDLERGSIDKIIIEKKVKDFLELGTDKAYIIKSDNIIYSKGSDIYGKEILELFSENIKGKSEGVIDKKEGSYVYKLYPEEEFTIIYAINKDYLNDDLMSLQKNLLLITIISLIFSVQVIIFTAYNLSKPLKKLAASCKRISKGAYEEKTDIKRNDEIGILSDSFNEMVDNIRIYTKKIEDVKEFNEDILRNIPLGIMTVDNNFNIKSLNETGIKTLKEVTLKDFILTQMAETIKVNSKISNMYEIKQSDGTEKFYEVTTNLMTESSSLSAISIFSDVTERKEIESRMERLNRLTSFGRIAAGLAHEIRNPLTGMKGGIYVIKKRLEKEGNKKYDELLKVVLEEIERINILVTELLDFTKKRHPVLQDVNIEEALEKVEYLISEELKQKNIRLHTHIDINEDVLEDAAISHFIKFNKDQLEQILLNLAYNAISAIGSNGDINIHCSIQCDCNNIKYIFSVKDNGSGIEKEDLPKIFDPFFTKRAKGTGLGLAVVQKIVEDNNGEINVNSILGKGTVFILTFFRKVI